MSLPHFADAVHHYQRNHPHNTDKTFVGLAEGLINAELTEPTTTAPITTGTMQYAAALTLPSLSVEASASCPPWPPGKGTIYC